jgi:DNA (cytosine-5)-methyltransferase 1
MDLGAEGGFVYLNKRFTRLNTKIVFAMDFDASIASIYNDNFVNPMVVGDVKTIKSSSIPEHDILTGGFPCQSFSVVAQNPVRLGYKDEKGKLFFEMCRILRDRKPKAFIAENVKGILSANKGQAFPLIVKEFAKSGYLVKHTILNASHFGVPQKRERVFIVGFLEQEAFSAFSFPTPNTKNNPVTLNQIVHPPDDVEEKYFFSDRAVAGMKNTKHSKTMNKGRAQPLDQPCNTVGAHLAKVSINSTDPVLRVGKRFRMFTPREVARIQSFPESFELNASRSTNYKALGNAVPPVLMWHVTCSVLKALRS